MQISEAAVHEHHWFDEPTKPVGPKFISGIVFAQFVFFEALLGLAYGIYAAVDLALVVDVLPNPDDSGKDLGVFNIASALPQTAAPVVGAALLAVGSVNNQNYGLMLYVAGAMALIGALVVVPIKGVR